MVKIHGPRDDKGCGDIAFPKDLILSERILLLLKQYESEWKHLVVTKDQSTDIEMRTRLQSEPPE